MESRPAIELGIDRAWIECNPVESTARLGVAGYYTIFAERHKAPGDRSFYNRCRANGGFSSANRQATANIHGP
jgi:hypothetical protein